MADCFVSLEVLLGMQKLLMSNERSSLHALFPPIRRFINNPGSLYFDPLDEHWMIFIASAYFPLWRFINDQRRDLSCSLAVVITCFYYGQLLPGVATCIAGVGSNFVVPIAIGVEVYAFHHYPNEVKMWFASFCFSMVLVPYFGDKMADFGPSWEPLGTVFGPPNYLPAAGSKGGLFFQRPEENSITYLGPFGSHFEPPGSLFGSSF